MRWGNGFIRVSVSVACLLLVGAHKRTTPPAAPKPAVCDAVIEVTAATEESCGACGPDVVVRNRAPEGITDFTISRTEAAQSTLEEFQIYGGEKKLVGCSLARAAKDSVGVCSAPVKFKIVKCRSTHIGDTVKI
jgi:hypothetical protein